MSPNIKINRFLVTKRDRIPHVAEVMNPLSYNVPSILRAVSVRSVIAPLFSCPLHFSAFRESLYFQLQVRSEKNTNGHGDLPYLESSRALCYQCRFSSLLLE